MVYKNARRIVLRCGSSDGTNSFNPADPTAVSVCSFPVLSAVEMHRLLAEPGHRVFAVHVTADAGNSQSPGASPGAVLAAVADTDVRQVLLDHADRFPEELPAGLPPARGVSHTFLWSLTPVLYTVPCTD